MVIYCITLLRLYHIYCTAHSRTIVSKYCIIMVALPDSIGATPAESNAAYDKLVKDHPSSVLALNHEVYSTFLFFSFEIP